MATPWWSIWLNVAYARTAWAPNDESMMPVLMAGLW